MNMLSLGTMRREIRLLAVIPLVVLLAYAVAFPGHFFMDDAQIVLDNLLIYSPDLKVIFTSDYWGAGENTGLFRPLTILSFSINYLLLGQNAWGYLLVNLMLHAGVCVLLYLWMRRFDLSLEACWFATVLFAVHPIHGEAVIQLVGRSELLTAFFVLLGLLSAETAQGMKGGLIVISCYLGAILSKEHGIVMLALIPAIDYFRTDRSLYETLRKRRFVLGGMFVLTCVWLLYRVLVVHRGISEPLTLDPYYIPLAAVDAPLRILSALKLQLLYLAKLVIPFQLQGMYPQSTVVPYLRWSSPAGILVFLLSVGIIGLGIRGYFKRSFPGLAAILYIISFSPTSNIVFPAGFTMAERVVYLPSLWFCAGYSLTLCYLLKRVDRPKLLNMGLVVTGGAYAIAAIIRFTDFRDPEKYWLHDLDINPRNELSLVMLADYYRGAGRLAEAEVRGRELTTVVAPDFKEGLSNYAGILAEMNRPQEAINVAQRAIALSAPGEVSSAKIPLAAAYLKLGRFDETLKTLENVRTTDRSQPVYWELYGKALEGKGDLLGALACYQKEAVSNGGRAKDGLRRLGQVLLLLGRAGEAEEHLRRDVRINPRVAAAWNSLGIALDLQGKNDEAQKAFQAAVDLQPESQEYRANLERSRRH